MKAVSVIIPTHNRISYLRLALESVLRQDYPVFEAIVVDDGSTDGTDDLVHGYSDSRVRYVHQENAGRSAARNHGLRLASGDYVAFLDDDDLYMPGKLGRQVCFLDENPEVDLVGGSAMLIDTEGSEAGTWGPPSRTKLTLPNALYACPLMPSTVMVRRVVFEHLVQWFDPSLEPVEDKDFFLRVVSSGGEVVVLPEAVSFYRVHATNSQGNGPHIARQSLACLDKILSLPTTPMEVKDQRRRLFSHYYLTGSLHAFATDHVEAARDLLDQAVADDPRLLTGDVPPVVERIAGFAQTFHVTRPLDYIDRVFDNLPSSIRSLRAYRREARGAYHFERVYRDYAAGRRPRISDFVRGGFAAPHRLRNRGAWAILVRSCVLGSRMRRASTR